MSTRQIDQSEQDLRAAFMADEGAQDRRPSERRFVVLGGPGGYLTCRPAGCPMISDRYRRWVVLFSVRRPLTDQLAHEAKRAALRRFELVSA